MAHLRFSAFHVPVLNVHQLFTNPGFLVYYLKNHATNLSHIVLTGQF